jgi:hypothetical protein
MIGALVLAIYNDSFPGFQLEELTYVVIRYISGL